MTFETDNRQYTVPHEGQKNYADELINAWKLLDTDIGELFTTQNDHTTRLTGITETGITKNELTLELDEPVSADEGFHENMVQIGNYGTKTDDTLLALLNAGLWADAGDVWGVSSNIINEGDGLNFFGNRSRVHARSNSHTQAIAYLGRVIQEDGSDGELPPSAGVYIDSRGSTVRPFGAFVDDGMSIWEHGIVLNGDYSETIIRTPEWTLQDNGTVERSGGVIKNTVGPKTAYYEAADDDEIVLVDSSGGEFNVFMYTGDADKGRTRIIKDATGACESNRVLIVPQDPGTIDGDPSYSLNTAYESVECIGDGNGNWLTV